MLVWVAVLCCAALLVVAGRRDRFGWGGFVGVGEFGEGVAEVVGEVRGEEAEEHVGFDAVFQVVVHGS